jgi:hypothetical protein
MPIGSVNCLLHKVRLIVEVDLRTVFPHHGFQTGEDRVNALDVIGKDTPVAVNK